MYPSARPSRRCSGRRSTPGTAPGSPGRRSGGRPSQARCGCWGWARSPGPWPRGRCGSWVTPPSGWCWQRRPGPRPPPGPRSSSASTPCRAPGASPPAGGCWRWPPRLAPGGRGAWCWSAAAGRPWRRSRRRASTSRRWRRPTGGCWPAARRSTRLTPSASASRRSRVGGSPGPWGRPWPGSWCWPTCRAGGPGRWPRGPATWGPTRPSTPTSSPPPATSPPPPPRPRGLGAWRRWCSGPPRIRSRAGSPRPRWTPSPPRSAPPHRRRRAVDRRRGGGGRAARGRRGAGGRATHLAAAVLQAMAGAARPFAFLAGASDGRDGDGGGGAAVDGDTACDPEDLAGALARFDTGPLHRRLGTALGRLPPAHQPHRPLPRPRAGGPHGPSCAPMGTFRIVYLGTPDFAVAPLEALSRARTRWSRWSPSPTAPAAGVASSPPRR